MDAAVANPNRTVLDWTMSPDYGHEVDVVNLSIGGRGELLTLLVSPGAGRRRRSGCRSDSNAT